jgi:hypothetical protein
MVYTHNHYAFPLVSRLAAASGCAAITATETRFVSAGQCATLPADRRIARLGISARLVRDSATVHRSCGWGEIMRGQS